MTGRLALARNDGNAESFRHPAGYDIFEESVCKSGSHARHMVQTVRTGQETRITAGTRNE
jgi:hypothetical protein